MPVRRSSFVTSVARIETAGRRAMTSARRATASLITVVAIAAASPNPGRPVPHRLNRAEYTNAIRDLLAVESESQDLLPPDDSGYGFDNVADVLSMSPGLLERYLLAARRISRVAVGDPAIRP